MHAVYPIFCFSLPELIAQVIFSDRLMSVVRLSVHFHIFIFFSRTVLSTKLGTNHSWANEGSCPFPLGEITVK